MNEETITRLLRIFEEIYAERGVYRVLAQRLPDCKERADRLMADPEYRKEITQTFSALKKRLDAHQQFEEIFKHLDKYPLH